MTVEDTDTDTDTEAERPAAEPDSPRSSSRLVPTVALGIALLAAGIAAWSIWQMQSLRNLPTRLSGDEGQLTELNRRIDMLLEDVGKQREERKQLRTELEQLVSAVTDVPLRLEQVEQAVANIPELNPQSRSDWRKSEALYYLRVANAQALLSGNAEITANALQLADDKLREAGDPAMAKVRARIAEETASLEAMPKIDRTGISFRLQTLLARADDWPFRSLAPDSFLPDTPEPAAELDPWDRFIATLRSVFASVITVKKTDSAPTIQLSVVEKSLIVEGVKAELQVARLAFASGNTELFSQSLARANKEIELYFDVDAPAVVAALETLVEVRAIELPGALPDITGSLSLMLATLNEARAAKAESVKATVAQ
jgi:uroporphyrin-3 C-methyltransferase